jgi:hypothetical protein
MVTYFTSEWPNLRESGLPAYLQYGWMDDFIYADPSRTICSIQQLCKYMICTMILYDFLDELGASPEPAVAS